MAKILQEIYRYKIPNFYSITRSIRDGYTPRMKHSLIEKTILESIENIIAKYKTKTPIVYDQYFCLVRLDGKEISRLFLKM